ncbi:nucleotidyltransferase domain-containing protein [Prevotella sp.]|uniref:nucleotidyltransferase domain-containing protein n=1 Tax=Prevotella sp. TaxID=59823 RepID=UPI003F7F2DE6
MTNVITVNTIGLTDAEMLKLVSVLSSQPNIEKSIVYGARAKGTNKKFSDVVMTLVGSKLTRHDLNHAVMFIDDILLPYEFDLSLYSSLKNEVLLEHIDRVGKLIYKA